MPCQQPTNSEPFTVKMMQQRNLTAIKESTEVASGSA